MPMFVPQPVREMRKVKASSKYFLVDKRPDSGLNVCYMGGAIAYYVSIKGD